jgi:hypothetical protein
MQNLILRILVLILSPHDLPFKQKILDRHSFSKCGDLLLWRSNTYPILTRDLPRFFYSYPRVFFIPSPAFIFIPIPAFFILSPAFFYSYPRVFFIPSPVFFLSRHSVLF